MLTNLKALLRPLLAFAALSSAPQALAGLSAEASYGVETAPWRYESGTDVKSKTMKGHEVAAAFEVSPLPFIPVGFGVAVSSHSFDTSSLNKEVLAEGLDPASVSASGKVTGLTYGPQVTAWLPLFFAKPFIRLGYMLGSYKETASGSFHEGGIDSSASGEATYKSTGFGYGVGFTWTPLPFLGLMFEYHRQDEVHTMSKLSETVQGATEAVDLSTVNSGLKKQIYQAAAIRIGLKLAF